MTFEKLVEMAIETVEMCNSGKDSMDILIDFAAHTCTPKWYEYIQIREALKEYFNCWWKQILEI